MEPALAVVKKIVCMRVSQHARSLVGQVLGSILLNNLKTDKASTLSAFSLKLCNRAKLQGSNCNSFKEKGIISRSTEK